MNTLSPALALSALALSACSTASGPTFSVSELQPREGVRTFQVDCHGLLTGPDACMRAAHKICGDQPVRTVDSVRPLRDGSDPATLVFQCDTARDEAVSADQPTPAAVEHRNLLGYALFATDHATLAPHARASLDRLLSEREDHTYSEVTVTGFTDSMGGTDYNLALSKRRADAVAAYLKAHGLKAATIAVTGCGEVDPVTSNATAEGRASNRRVEILLQR